LESKQRGASTASAYDSIAAENAALKRQLKALETKTKKRAKRPPNDYQKAWALEYKLELLRAQSSSATTTSYCDASAEEGIPQPELIPYSKQYGSTMNTAPNPKNGEPLETGDRATFMQNVGRRTKAVRFNLAPTDDASRSPLHTAGDAALPPRAAEGEHLPTTADIVEAVDVQGRD
jgi:hypothetical protein